MAQKKVVLQMTDDQLAQLEGLRPDSGEVFAILGEAKLKGDDFAELKGGQARFYRLNKSQYDIVARAIVKAFKL